MKATLWLAVLLALGMLGCGPAISTSLQREAGAPVKFADLTAHPEQYRGRVVILGGKVMTLQPLGKGSLLSVDQIPLDARYRPIQGPGPLDTAPSGGTFLVESDRWLYSGYFVPKRMVTVAGVVKGQRDGWPLIQAREIHLWEYPLWEKFYYPVPREWYNYDPNLEYWFTPPYFDPYRHEF